MNNTLQEFARQKLKDGLKELPEEWQRKFKMMYATGGKRVTNEVVMIPIDRVVDEMPEEKLDWAMEQVRKSLEKMRGM